MISSLVDVFPLSEREGTILFAEKYIFYVYMLLNNIVFLKKRGRRHTDRQGQIHTEERERLRDRHIGIQRKRQTDRHTDKQSQRHRQTNI